MIYKINNNYYIKIYQNRYNEVVFKNIKGNICLVPTDKVLESISGMNAKECNVEDEKKKFIKEQNDMGEKKPISHTKKY